MSWPGQGVVTGSDWRRGVTVYVMAYVSCYVCHSPHKSEDVKEREEKTATERERVSQPRSEFIHAKFTTE